MDELRASDADRERTAERLRAAGGDGRLTMEELDERVHAAYAATTHGELARLMTDLESPQPRTGVVVREGEGGARYIVSVLGGSDRRGRWRLAPRAKSLNILGGANIDLSEVELAAPRTELTVFSLLGGADVIVPEGLTVEVSEFAFLGGNDIEIDRSSGDGPVVHLRVISILGGANVKRPKKKRD
jgi:hypothetical protein